MNMQEIKDYPLQRQQAVLWFLGQAGYIIKSDDKIVTIDPYLSDSAAKASPELSRAFPVPLDPRQLEVDVYIVTHDHLDHLDPETIEAYSYKDKTLFVGPALAIKKLRALGISRDNTVQIDTGHRQTVNNILITGIYAIATEPAVIDTCGYKLEFSNGRKVYHSSDTGFSELLAPCVRDVEVALVCINGKWGNLNCMEAAKLVAKIRPRTAIPNHYDLMACNSEDPKIFESLVRKQAAEIDVRILSVMEPFLWGDLYTEGANDEGAGKVR